MTIPTSLSELLKNFESAFTQPSFARFCYLAMAAVVTTGSKTISNILRTVSVLSFGHPTSFHRLFSKRRWKPWVLSFCLMKLIFKVFYQPDEIIRLAGDDTVTEHKGKNVYGKGRHRDAVRSSHKYTAFRWGHKWVVLSILVQIPGIERPWALPVMVALYRPKEKGKPHKTSPDLIRGMLRQTQHFFPERKFIFCGDQSFAVHEIAKLSVKSKNKITIVSKFYPKACLYNPAPEADHKVGRPRKRGQKILSPKQVVDRAQRMHHLEVRWYGGGKRNVKVITGIGCWHKAGRGLVPVRWVFVQDETGTHRDEYFFSTDQSMSPQKIIEIYTSRWSLEVTFEEVRSYLKLQTTRGWKENTVMRMAPCLFGLYSGVVLLYHSLPAKWKNKILIDWNGKDHLCFSDVMTTVRRYLWMEWVFENLPGSEAVAKLSPKLKSSLLYALAPAA